MPVIVRVAVRTAGIVDVNRSVWLSMRNAAFILHNSRSEVYDPEITRFKGLGEISPEEFAHFIGPDMRLEQVTLHKTDQVQKLLEYYMGKNTMERQNFIIENLVIEEDIPEEDSAPLD